MRHGITNKHTTGYFNLRECFDIPQGTPVIYGAADCEGKAFPHWTLSQETAFKLSDNSHDSQYRFVVVHPDHVTES